MLIDPKTPNFSLYKNAFLMTPNRKETQDAAGIPTESRDDILAAGRTIIKKHACTHLLTTLGANGMALFLTSNTIIHIPSAARRVF
jgi:bifunctional ADP-heptose synthase (sugar kinase/adenylyltransferase)